MNGERSRAFADAMRYLDEGRAEEALRIGESLVRSTDEGDRLSGYLCRGFVYEDGAVDFNIDLDRAMYNYLQASLIAPDPITYAYLARVSMKKGEYPYALRYLNESASMGSSIESILGFAHYYREKPNKELEVSKRFYLRAALRGRFSGFFGYSQVAREAGQTIRAIAMDVVRVILGPFIAIVMGVKARDRF